LNLDGNGNAGPVRRGVKRPGENFSGHDAVTELIRIRVDSFNSVTVSPFIQAMPFRNIETCFPQVIF
jgi:hypothetical protein